MMPNGYTAGHHVAWQITVSRYLAPALEGGKGPTQSTSRHPKSSIIAAASLELTTVDPPKALHQEGLLHCAWPLTPLTWTVYTLVGTIAASRPNPPDCLKALELYLSSHCLHTCSDYNLGPRVHSMHKDNLRTYYLYWSSWNHIVSSLYAPVKRYIAEMTIKLTLTLKVSGSIKSCFDLYLNGQQGLL